MNPYLYIREATRDGGSLLSLCCGIGLELSGLNTKEITAVDIAPQYTNIVKLLCPQAKTVTMDSLEYIKTVPDKSFDVISIIDGIEHMEKKAGLKLITEMKRVAKNKILLFTPQGLGKDGYLKNEPHNAWGVEGADHYQVHKSGWTLLELHELGFKALLVTNDISQHNEPYYALMMEYACSQ